MSEPNPIVDIQQENKIKKPTGFQLFPENINKDGRPPKGKSMAERILNELMQVEANSGAEYGDLVIKSLVLAAVRGDISAIKEINDRIDGKSVQRVEAKVTNVGEELGKLEKTNYSEYARKIEGQSVEDGEPLQNKG